MVPIQYTFLSSVALVAADNRALTYLAIGLAVIVACLVLFVAWIEHEARLMVGKSDYYGVHAPMPQIRPLSRRLVMLARVACTAIVGALLALLAMIWLVECGSCQ